MFFPRCTPNGKHTSEGHGEIRSNEPYCQTSVTNSERSGIPKEGRGKTGPGADYTRKVRLNKLIACEFFLRCGKLTRLQGCTKLQLPQSWRLQVGRRTRPNPAPGTGFPPCGPVQIRLSASRRKEKIDLPTVNFDDLRGAGRTPRPKC